MQENIASRRKLRWLVGGFVLFISAIAILTESSVLAPAIAGVPAYESLDVVAGKVVQVGVCVGRRGPSSVPVWLMANGTRVETHLPCTFAIQELRNRIGTSLEVRSRQFSPSIIDSPYADVWSVKAGNADLYSYQARAERSRAHFWGYASAVIYAMLMGLIGGVFAWGLLRRRTAREEN